MTAAAKAVVSSTPNRTRNAVSTASETPTPPGMGTTPPISPAATVAVRTDKIPSDTSKLSRMSHMLTASTKREPKLLASSPRVRFGSFKTSRNAPNASPRIGSTQSRSRCTLRTR